MFIGPCIIAIVEWKTNFMSLAFLFHLLRAQHVSDIIYPSSGACDCVDELPRRSSCSQFVVCWRFGVAGFEWCSCCRLSLQNKHHPNTSRNKSSNTQRTENKTTDVVIHQHSRKLLKMDILMSERCWAHNKWNKIASDIKLVFHSSTDGLVCRNAYCYRQRFIVGRSQHLCFARHHCTSQ